MHKPEQHDMFLEKIYPSGVEEWHCSTCERCLFVAWKPSFMIITREAENKYFAHRIREDGSGIETAEIASIGDVIQSDGSRTSNKDARLAPWEAWMDEVNFDNFWDDKT